MRHVTRDMWHVTRRDLWHVTRDMFGGGVNIVSKFQLPSFTVCDLWYYEDLEEKDEWMNELRNQSVTRLFIEQPRLNRVC